MISAVYDLSLTDALLLVGLVGIILKTVAESFGWTPTNKLLREENSALQDRNHTLESEKAELILVAAESRANELQLLARIEALELKMRDLESRDQAAVLLALSEHEVRAQARADNAGVQNDLHHAEHVGLLERAVDALEGEDFQAHFHQGGPR